MPKVKALISRVVETGVGLFLVGMVLIGTLLERSRDMESIERGRW